MPNILLDCERMKFPNSGIYTYCHELGNALLKKKTEEEALCFYIPLREGRHFGPAAQYLWQRSLHKFCMLHRRYFHVWHTTYQTSLYRPQQARTRNVLTIHDLNFLHETTNLAKMKKLLNRVQSNINRADRIVVISRFVQEHVSQHLNTGGKPVDVIYNGAGMQEFLHHDTPVYRPKGAFLFTIGTVVPKKNFHTIPCLLENNKLELVIAGTINEAYRQKIMEAASLHHASHRVHLIGPVADADKYWYLKHCYAFIFPSLAEGFGIPVAEAMRLGKPVFISDRTSLPEVGGDAAYYFRDFEAEHMRKVFEEGMAHYEVQRPETAIKAQAARFNWDHAAGEYLKIYRSLY